MRQRALVLLHGFTGAPSSYDAVRSRLRNSHNVFAPHLPGHGQNWTSFRARHPSADTSFEAEVWGLSEQLHGFGISRTNPCAIVGYSLGARLALGLLCSHEDWFTQAVLVGVSPGLSDAEARETRRAQDEARAAQLELHGLEAFLTAWESERLFESQRTLQKSVLDEQSLVRRTNTAAGLAYSLRSAGLGVMPDYTPKLGQITTFVQLVVGERDAKFRRIAEQMQLVLPNAALAVVPGVGHNIPLEAPDALAALLNELPEDG